MKNNSPTLDSVFDEFQKIPKGVLIDRPDELVETDFYIHPSAAHIFSKGKLRLSFTRRTLKHVAEKGKIGVALMDFIPSICMHPDLLYESKESRYLLAKRLLEDKPGRFYVVILEQRIRTLIIVTSFLTDEKYLKNFEILWRTGASFA